MVVVYFESFWLLYFIAKLPSHKSCAAEGLIFSASVPVLFQQQFKKMDRFVLGFKPVKQFFYIQEQYNNGIPFVFLCPVAPQSLSLTVSVL